MSENLILDIVISNCLDISLRGKVWSDNISPDGGEQFSILKFSYSILPLLITAQMVTGKNVCLGSK